MTEFQKKQAPGAREPKIPAPIAEQIRSISHDLSNALEVILQTNYLLGMAGGAGTNQNPDQQKWREMLDQGVTQATEINRRLREYIQAHS